MTSAMQIRLWYRRATSAERGVTVGALVLVGCLIVASVAMSPPSQTASVDAFGADVLGVDGAPGAGESVGEDPLAIGAPEGEAAAAAAGDADATGSSGELSTDSGSTSTASGSTAGGPAGGSGDGSAGGSTTSIARAASDRGVTTTSVKVGFLLQNPAGLDGAGFSTGQRSDGRQYVAALAKWATASGRAGGREVVPYLRYTDPTSVEDQAAACRALVSDAKVFGVVDVASMLDTASIDCLVNRKLGDTPLVHSVMWSRDWQARSGGNEISYQAAVDRISITWARDLAAIKWFPKGATVGILGDKCPATQPTIENVLGPALKARGAGKVVFGNHDCNIEAVVAQPPNIATQFSLAGVTHVLTVTNFVATQVFTSSAASIGYQPKYSTSDWFLESADASSANYDADQFDGAIGIASLGSMLAGSKKQPYPGWELCSKIAEDAGLPPIPPGQPDSTELLSLCDNFMLFLDAFHTAGVNPTRASWRHAVTGLGNRTSALFGPSRFAPGKLTGSDFVHTIQWQRGCRCWRSISDFRPAAA